MELKSELEPSGCKFCAANVCWIENLIHKSFWLNRRVWFRSQSNESNALCLSTSHSLAVPGSSSPPCFQCVIGAKQKDSGWVPEGDWSRETYQKSDCKAAAKLEYLNEGSAILLCMCIPDMGPVFSLGRITVAPRQPPDQHHNRHNQLSQGVEKCGGWSHCCQQPGRRRMPGISGWRR